MIAPLRRFLRAFPRRFQLNNAMVAFPHVHAFRRGAETLVRQAARQVQYSTGVIQAYEIMPDAASDDDALAAVNFESRHLVVVDFGVSSVTVASAGGGATIKASLPPNTMTGWVYEK